MLRRGHRNIGRRLPSVNKFARPDVESGKLLRLKIRGRGPNTDASEGLLRDRADRTWLWGIAFLPDLVVLGAESKSESLKNIDGA